MGYIFIKNYHRKQKTNDALVKIHKKIRTRCP